MNILLMTNTYLPHVGGVARSVATFEQEYRRRGHRVLVVAPEFEGQAEDEPNVIRVPAIQHFNGSDFSFPVPVPGLLQSALREFKPDIVHSHHPFLLGAAAVRVAKSRQIPLVFTNHTLYEHYTHYVGSETNMLARFITTLTVGYSNLCDAVIAPSRSVADMLHERGVQSHVFIVPTGIETARFADGDGNTLRRELSLPDDAFVVGHVGRLTPEKNLPFLARAVTQFIKNSRLSLRESSANAIDQDATFAERKATNAHFLVVGAGPSEDDIRGTFREAGLEDRLHMVGVCQGQRLIDAYHAMDVFAFASQTETQGLVLVEAMAAGRPVVALDGPGVREVVDSGTNGELLAEQDETAFAEALARMAAEQAKHPRALRAAAMHTADTLSLERMAERALRIYGALVKHHGQRRPAKRSPWRTARKYIKAEIDYLIVGAKATGSMLGISE